MKFAMPFSLRPPSQTIKKFNKYSVELARVWHPWLLYALSIKGISVHQLLSLEYRKKGMVNYYTWGWYKEDGKNVDLFSRVMILFGLYRGSETQFCFPIMSYLNLNPTPIHNYLPLPKIETSLVALSSHTSSKWPQTDLQASALFWVLSLPQSGPQTAISIIIRWWVV